MFKLVAAAVVCLVLARVAAADPTDPEPTSPRDPGTAVALSLGGTAAAWAALAAGVASNQSPIAVVGALGVVAGPSFGEWYAGKPLTVGLGIRLASVAVVVAAEVKAVECDDGDAGCGAVGPLLVGGIIGLGAGTILDIALAPRAARDFNRAHAAGLHLSPTVISAPSGPVTGVGIGGAF